MPKIRAMVLFVALASALSVAGITANRIRIEAINSTQVIAELFFAERIPALMFLSHKDPKYLVIGFEGFEPAEGIVFPSQKVGFLSSLSIQKEKKFVILRARSDYAFRHKVLYSNEQKRYRVVLAVEGVPKSSPPSAIAKEAPHHYSLENITLDGSTIGLEFRGDLPPSYEAKPLSLETEILRIEFPDVRVEPVGELAGRRDLVRCQPERSGTACTIFLKGTPISSGKVSIQLKRAPASPELVILEAPQTAPVPETSPPQPAGTEPVTETPGPPPTEPEEVTAGESASAVAQPGEPESAPVPSEIESAPAPESEISEQPATTEAVPLEQSPPSAGEEATPPAETPTASETPAPPVAETAPAVEPTPPSAEPVESPEPPKTAAEETKAPTLENPWTATFEGDLKKVVYERNTDGAQVRLSFSKACNFVAQARVSEVRITALDVLSDFFVKDFPEGAVSRIEISPDLSGVLVIVQVREGYDARLSASGNDLILHLTRSKGPGEGEAQSPPK